MHNFFMFFGIFLILICLPISTIIFVVLKILKKTNLFLSILISASSVVMCLTIGLFCIFFGGFLYGQTDEYKKSKEQSEVIEKVENEEEQSEVIEKVENEEEQSEVIEKVELTEEEYKELCKEMYYDDIFFGDDIDKGYFVKLHLMVSENYYFDADALYSTSFLGLMKEWSLYRDFKKCSVLRENEDSYAGKGKIDLYFSDKYEYNPEDYDLGSKIIVYGEIISFSNNTWDGYNNIIVVPKYINYE